MKPCLCVFFVLSLFAKLCPNAAAQTKTASQTEDQPASLAIRGGLAQLYGDLKDQVSMPFGGASLIVPITKTISVELPIDVGQLRAEQEEFYHSSAKAQFIQGAIAASVDILQVVKSNLRLVEIRPYGGAGLLFFRAQAYDLKTGQLQRLTNNENSHRTRDGIETRGNPGVKRTHELVWLAGLRGSTALSRRMSVFGDVRFNLVRTDKLDATLDNNNQVMQPGSPAYTEGNHYRSNSHDKWGYVAIGVNMYFGERFKKNR